MARGASGRQIFIHFEAAVVDRLRASSETMWLFDRIRPVTPGDDHLVGYGSRPTPACCCSPHLIASVIVATITIPKKKTSSSAAGPPVTATPHPENPSCWPVRCSPKIPHATGSPCRTAVESAALSRMAGSMTGSRVSSRSSKA